MSDKNPQHHFLGQPSEDAGRESHRERRVAGALERMDRGDASRLALDALVLADEVRRLREALEEVKAVADEPGDDLESDFTYISELAARALRQDGGKE